MENSCQKCKKTCLITKKVVRVDIFMDILKGRQAFFARRVSWGVFSTVLADAACKIAEPVAEWSR